MEMKITYKVDYRSMIPVQGKVVWVGGLQEGNPIGDVYAQQESIFKDDADVKAKAITGTMLSLASAVRIARIQEPASPPGCRGGEGCR